MGMNVIANTYATIIGMLCNGRKAFVCGQQYFRPGCSFCELLKTKANRVCEPNSGILINEIEANLSSGS